jgi:chromosome segregation ATPase
MSEPIVYFGIGLLLAVSLIFGVRALTHTRVGRFAMRRLESAAPTMMADIEADMDQLHSQIAVATRRLELSVEQMKIKTTSQLGEIGKTSETIGRLKAEQAERNVAVVALQDKERALASKLRLTEAELGARTRSLHEVEQTLSDRKLELEKFTADLKLHPELAKIEARHAADMESLQTEKASMEEQLDQSLEDCARLQNELDSMKKQVETTWASERMANAVLRERINDVASEVVRVAVALEGLNSPMDSLAAGKIASAQAQAAAAAGSGGNGQELLPIFDGVDGSRSELIHRIRALRQRAARISATG